MVAVRDDHQLLEGERQSVAPERAAEEEHGEAVALVAPEEAVGEQVLRGLQYPGRSPSL